MKLLNDKVLFYSMKFEEFCHVRFNSANCNLDFQYGRINCNDSHILRIQLFLSSYFFSLKKIERISCYSLFRDIDKTLCKERESRPVRYFASLESDRLTEANITDFVNYAKEYVLISIFQ